MAKSISIPITGNAAPLRKTLDNTSKRMSKFGSSVSTSFAKIGKAAAIGGAAAAAGALALGKAAFSAAEAASTSNARLEQIATSMGLFGDQATNVADRLIGLANEQARLTGVNQNTIKESQALLLTFSELAESADEAGGAFDRATQLTLDMAAAGFGSATDNAKQLGKALNDPIKGISALARSGVTFTEQQKELIESLVESGELLQAQDLILTEIENQVGGTAAATANASDRIKVAFSQVTEQLGLALLPLFEKLTGFVLDTVVPGIQRLVDVFEEDGLLGVLKMVGGWIVDGAQFAAEQLWEYAKTVGSWMLDTGLPYLTGKAAEWGSALWGWIQTDGKDAIVRLGLWVFSLGQWIVTEGLPRLGEQTVKLATALFDWIGEAGPKAISALAVWAFNLGTWIKENGAETLRNFAGNLVDAVYDWIYTDESSQAAQDAGKTAAENIATSLVTELGPALLRLNIEIYNAVIGALEEVFKRIGKRLGTELAEGIGEANIGGGLLNTLLKLNPTEAMKDLLGRATSQIGVDVPGLAAGGNVTRNRPYVVGENGPELFMPHTSGRIVPNHALGGAGGINVTVNMPAGSDGSDVVRAIQKYARKSGTLAIPTTSLVR